MKKLVITLAMLIPVLAGFASGPEINPEVLQAFTKAYSQASDIQWEEGDNYYKATFISGSRTTYAFYTGTGKQICLTRHILSAELPSRLQKQLTRKYQEYWIADLFEYTDGETTAYHIILKNADTKIMLKATNEKGWKKQ